MPPPILTLVLALFCVLPFVTALPTLSDENIPRSWDFHLLNAALPTCNAHAPNTDLSIFHRYGPGARDCVALDRSRYNTTNVKSIVWKSPRANDMFDLCLFRTPDCSGGAPKLAASVTNGWEVCMPFEMFRGWMVVGHGDSCF